MSFIIWCTILSIVFKSSSESLLHKVSIVTTVKKLFHFDEASFRTAGVDLLRVLFVIAGSISHNLVCIEVPLGLFISSKFQCSKLGLMIETNSATSLQTSIQSSIGSFLITRHNFCSMKAACQE